MHSTHITIHTAQKMKFSIKDFFSKCDQIRRRNPSWKTSFFVQCQVKHGDMGYTFFYKQPCCKVSNVKKDLNVKQLAKQPPALKTLLQKFFVEL